MKRFDLEIYIKNFDKINEYLKNSKVNSSKNNNINNFIENEEIKELKKIIPLELDSNKLEEFYQNTGLNIRHDLTDKFATMQCFDRFGSYPNSIFGKNCLIGTGKYDEDIELSPIEDIDIVIDEDVDELTMDIFITEPKLKS